MSFQTFALVPPSEEGAHQNSTQIADNDQNIFCFIEALLRQEQRSKHYQGQLESKIHSDAAEFQRSRAQILRLQRVVCGLQHQRSQLETSLAYMAEACRVMARDAGLEKVKVQELESRLSEVYPSIDSLLQYLAPGEHNGDHLNDEGVNGHLLLENQRQREFINSLEANLLEREEAIRELKSRLEETVQEHRLASHGQHESDRLSPYEMTGGTSEESSVEIITGSSVLY
ncbi:uncharacterized protein N7458_002584 [Penicillium daleae]|uniref:Uncharacterized protein n=1 Tax=Penicillium daleae TaxID=63821 RepID=A0AAD6G7B1_9EURO|nr:uncharacterized protein N7458_002584 [Penicillium daleae]KAJ5461032.1 hypothetical protein N7458_002584 [Penicillium daleae]